MLKKYSHYPRTDHGLGVAQHPATQLGRASLAGVDTVAHRGHLGQVWRHRLVRSVSRLVPQKVPSEGS